MGWKGYEQALQHNPEGVKAVLRVAGDIPQTEGRRLMSPSIELELAHIIERESNWRPDIVNSIGATGLIQFTIPTAEQLGTTTKELKQMSLQQQAKYVAKYFDRITSAVGPARKPGDLYIMTFYPKVYSAPSDYVIGAKDSPGKWERLIWEQNPGLRCDGKEGPITVACVRSFGTPQSEPPSGLPDLTQPQPTVSGKSGGALGVMFVLFLAWMYKKGNLPLPLRLSGERQRGQNENRRIGMQVLRL